MKYNVVGRSVTQFDTVGRVTGKTIYADDRIAPDEVVLKILFARRPHARVLGIDTTEAEALPGVIGVLTAKDVPVNEYGQQKDDQPVLCGPGSPSGKPGEDVVRFIGDQVAVVLAEDEETGAKARDLIRVRYEDLPIVDDPVFAMSGEAYALHEDTPDNIFETVRIRKGDPDSAWDDCDVIIDSEYRLPFQEHIYLQPEAGWGYLDDEGRITVHTAGQWAWEDRREIAHSLDIPLDRVRVVYDAIGGAFGGKEDVSVQIVVALAVQWLAERGIRRPVRCVWTREESVIGHCKRHPMVIHSKWGAKADGMLVAADIRIVSDGGAYVSTSNKVLRNASITATGPYEFPHAKLDAFSVYTNNLFSGAFRGFGATQGAVVAEMQMNKLAAALEMDPIEIRRKNALTDDKLLTVGTPIPGGISLEEVMDETARAANWQTWQKPRAADYAGNELPEMAAGRGLAVGFKNVGFSYDYHDNAWASVEVHGEADIEEVVVHVDGADLGQGHHTAIAQIAAETLGVPLERVRPIVTDTSTVKQSTGCAAASRLTFMGGNAVVKAACLALEKWQNEDRPAIAEAVWEAPQTSNFDPENGYCTPNFAYGYAAQLVDLKVNTETGVITVEKVICADDVGKAINPELVKGQIEGAISQAHGYVLHEDFRMERGQVLTPDMNTYLIPGIQDMPAEFETIIVEEPHPEGPFGVRGVGEIPFLPYAPALIAAVFDATGVWFDEFPLTPERVLRGLGKIPS